ncbi:MAG: hypothetical protein DMD67_10265 [Gemmatimonadetes bacterium]|nr:MAG: hypothetical protein DMD67_10265 [Gemmatimonadota bacterium]
MFSETLLLGRVRSETEQMRSLEIIDQEARRLTHLVENLLHFSRSERQIARLSPAPTALAQLVRQTVEAFTPLAAARGVALATELHDGLVAPVDADALRQMLLNLLDNAVKYGSEEQTITVGLRASERGRRARIWVDDQGPGIPAADRERIWDRFWRLERDRGSAVAGTGIGLSVVRELVALHDGRVWAEDAPGRGRPRTPLRASMSAPTLESPREADPRRRGQSRPRLRAAQQPRDRRLRRRCRGGRDPGPRARAQRRARSHHSRPDAPRHGRVPRASRAARRGSPHAYPHSHGSGRGGRQGPRAPPRRR